MLDVLIAAAFGYMVLLIEAIRAGRFQQVILETHSEHLILRLLRRIRESASGKQPADLGIATHDLAIWYLAQEPDGLKARRIRIDIKGEFIDPWPDDFFEVDFYERFPDAR